MGTPFWFGSTSHAGGASRGGLRTGDTALFGQQVAPSASAIRIAGEGEHLGVMHEPVDHGRGKFEVTKMEQVAFWCLWPRQGLGGLGCGGV